MNDAALQERRRHVRRPCTGPARILIIGLPGQNIGLDLVDLSTGGIGFTSTVRLSPGAHIAVAGLAAEVRWSATARGGFLVGAEFV